MYAHILTPTCTHTHPQHHLDLTVFASGLDGSGCVTHQFCLRSLNPLGFSENASAPFNGEQRISTQLPQSPPLSPRASLYLHMSKKQELCYSLHCLYKLLIAVPKASVCLFLCHWKLLKELTFFLNVQINLVKHSVLLPHKDWVIGVVISLYPPCSPTTFRCVLSRRNFLE